MDLTEARKRIIVAVDVPTLIQAQDILSALSRSVGFFKLGLELLVKYGLEGLGIRRGVCDAEQIFIDAKLADIPSTVGAAAKQIAGYGVGMFNVHASAGKEAMKAAVANRGESNVLAVTVLTSLNLDECCEIFGATPENHVPQLVRMAQGAGVQGIICSPKELTVLNSYDNLELLLKVTPGVRPEWAATNDQKRVMTPAEAIRAGATHLVVGRPITKPPESIGSMEKAADLIAEEIAGVLEEVTT